MWPYFSGWNEDHCQITSMEHCIIYYEEVGVYSQKEENFHYKPLTETPP